MKDSKDYSQRKVVVIPSAALTQINFTLTQLEEDMEYNNRTCMIFNVSEVNKVNFDYVLETSADTLRLSVDETKTFVKWNGPAPAFIAQLNTKEGPYTHQQMLDVLSTSDWAGQSNEEE